MLVRIWRNSSLNPASWELISFLIATKFSFRKLSLSNCMESWKNIKVLCPLIMEADGSPGGHSCAALLSLWHEVPGLVWSESRPEEKLGLHSSTGGFLSGCRMCTTVEAVWTSLVQWPVSSLAGLTLPSVSCPSSADKLPFLLKVVRVVVCGLTEGSFLTVSPVAQQFTISESAPGKHIWAENCQMLVALMLVKAEKWTQTVRLNHMKDPFYGAKTV